MRKGFTLIEMILIVAIIAVVIAVSALPVQKFYRTYKFKEYAYSIESSVRLAKLIAMERSINVDICVENNTLTVYDAGTSRSCSCRGNVLTQIRIEEPWLSLSINTGNCVNFDPRGLGILSGTICLRSNESEFSIRIQRLRSAIVVREGEC